MRFESVNVPLVCNASESLPKNHWNDIGVQAMAATVKLAVLPRAAARVCGCVTITGGVASSTTISFVEYAVLPKASATASTTTLVPNGKIAAFVGSCVVVRGLDKSSAKMKLVPVTSGITATQFESAASTRLVKLHKIAGGVVSRTMTARVAVLVLPLPSTAR